VVHQPRLKIVFRKDVEQFMVIRMGSKQGDVLKGIDQIRAEIQRRLQEKPAEWLQTLQENPGKFADLEQSVHHAFQQMADQMVAGLLAQATQPPEFTQAAKKKSPPKLL
jgi:hypothetical protein